MPQITRDQVRVPADVMPESRDEYIANYLKATRGTGRLMLFACDQKIEHLHHSDSGSTIDEVREGGEARSISVQPHYGHTPAYDIVPERTTPNPLSGQRVWNVLKF